jgi:hypothetical protein
MTAAGTARCASHSRCRLACGGSQHGPPGDCHKGLAHRLKRPLPSCAALLPHGGARAGPQRGHARVRTHLLEGARQAGPAARQRLLGARHARVLPLHERRHPDQVVVQVRDDGGQLLLQAAGVQSRRQACLAVQVGGHDLQGARPGGEGGGEGEGAVRRSCEKLWGWAQDSLMVRIQAGAAVQGASAPPCEPQRGSEHASCCQPLELRRLQLEGPSSRRSSSSSRRTCSSEASSWL